MRVGEVSALDLVDFAISESVFRVNGKGGRDRLALIVDEQTLRIQRDHFELRSQRYTHITKEHLVQVLRERHPWLALRFAS
jgi:site-specific recombinase XerD